MKKAFVEPPVLEGRALAYFNLLLPKEKELLRACAKSMPDYTNDSLPSRPMPDNKVRAEFLRFLMLGGDELSAIQERGIWLSGAWIEGDLNLNSAKIRFGFTFLNCRFDDPVYLADVEIGGTAVFHGCEISSVIAPRLSCSGAFSIVNSLVRHSLQIDNAKIGSDATFAASVFEFESASIFSASAIIVDGDFVLGKGFKISGSINLSGAKIGGSIFGDESLILSKGKHSIFGDRVAVSGTVFFNRATLEGECRLVDARIVGALSFVGAKLSNANGPAFSADRASIGGSVAFHKAICEGEVRFSGARLSSNLSFHSANLRANKACALIAERAVVDGHIFFVRGFHAIGKILLTGINVGGNLSCIASTIENGSEPGLSAEAITVGNAFFLRKMNKPVQHIILAAANIRHIVDDTKSWGERISIDGLTYQSFAGSASVDANSRLKWLDKQRPEHSGLSRSPSRFKPQPWRQLRKVLSDMGHFEAAREIAIEYEKRIRYAGLVGQSPENWWIVIKSANRMGAEFVHWIFGLLAGYGYRTSRLVAWLISVWLACGIFYWYAALNGVMAPSNPLVFKEARYKNCMTSEERGNLKVSVVRSEGTGNWYLCEELPEEYTGFSPLAYSLDILLPLVDLQQERDWAPKVPTPNRSWFIELTSLSLKHLTRLVLWFEIIFGWASSLLIVAVVSGLAKRTEE